MSTRERLFTLTAAAMQALLSRPGGYGTDEQLVERAICVAERTLEAFDRKCPPDLEVID